MVKDRVLCRLTVEVYGYQYANKVRISRIKFIVHYFNKYRRKGLFNLQRTPSMDQVNERDYGSYHGRNMYHP